MITGKNSILSYFESLQKPYFAIFYKGQVEKGNAIFRNDKDGEKDFDYAESKEAFEKMLNLLQYGDYTLVVDEKRNVTTRGANRTDFKIGLNESGSGVTNTAPVVAGIGSVSMDQVEQKANEIATKKFQELMDKKELADTKAKLAETEKQLREAEKSTQDPVNKLIGAMAPHSEAIISGIFGKNMGAAQQAPVVLSGVTPDEVVENDPEVNKIFEDFATVLIHAKPQEWKLIMVQLTNLIKNDPVKFEMALKLL